MAILDGRIARCSAEDALAQQAQSLFLCASKFRDNRSAGRALGACAPPAVAAVVLPSHFRVGSIERQLAVLACGDEPVWRPAQGLGDLLK